MTVLLVDDQINILSGLISGLDWDALGITSIRTAESAAKAKKIFENEKIDLLLCDIEMPGENGLSLLRWVRKNGHDTVCVFLTSHADFLYAKEAIQLGCFDYILQPARYEEIQSTVSRAISRLKSVHADKELKQYGLYAKNNPSHLFQNLFNDWLSEDSAQIPALSSALGTLYPDIRKDSDCSLICGHLLRWHKEPWPSQEWEYALNNILSEVCENACYKVIPFSIDRTSLGWFLYVPAERFPRPEALLESLNTVYIMAARLFSCDFAFYLSPTASLEQIGGQARKLLCAKRNNVFQKSGVFPLEDLEEAPSPAIGADVIQVRRWQELLMEGNGATLQEEIFKYLDELASREILNHTFLKNFWLQFQQIALNVFWYKGLNAESLLPILNRGMNAQYIDEIKNAVREIAGQFNWMHVPKKETEITKQIETYINGHLDQPLTVSDVANALFMNPDYISRVFKSKNGLSLKEYIINEKMHSAQTLLQTTTLPVSIIASKLGYDNYSYFSQVYRKTMGISPTDERKKDTMAET